ncbi:hypothetical protein FF1_037427 [Malus domestica]
MLNHELAQRSRLLIKSLILNTLMNRIHFLPTSRCLHFHHSRVKTAVCPPEITFSSSLTTIHHVEVGEIGLEQEDDHDREEIEVCAAEMTMPFKPLTVK